MAQRKGLHRILEVPFVYGLVQKLFSHPETRLLWAQSIQENRYGMVLDIGCGPGDQTFRDSAAYIGLDVSESCIRSAKKQCGSFGEFYKLSATEVDQLDYTGFDLVILKGVIHHLSDQEVRDCLRKVSTKLSSRGIVVTLDPTFIKGRVLANLLASLDRGMHVRAPSEISEIARDYMEILSCEVVTQKAPPYQRVLLKLANPVLA